MTTAVVILGATNAASLGLVAWMFSKFNTEHQAGMDSFMKLTETHSSSLMEMAEKIKRPDAQFIEAIKAQSAPIDTKDPVAELDEAWLNSEESLVSLGADDLSPVFDADEV